MKLILDAPQRDKAVYALRDIKGLLEHTQGKPGFDELDEIQTILAHHKLQIAPIHTATTSAVAAPTPAPTTAAALALSANERYTIESTYLASLKSLASREGFVFKHSQMKYVLKLLCRIAGIPFPE